MRVNAAFSSVGSFILNNVRTLHQQGKLDNVILEMDSVNMFGDLDIDQLV